MSIDTEDTFEPTYEVPTAKKKVVSELKKLVKSHETVWLATDEDREGEAISWHLAEVLKLDPDKTKRIVFHEITKPAHIRCGGKSTKHRYEFGQCTTSKTCLGSIGRI